MWVVIAGMSDSDSGSDSESVGAFQNEKRAARNRASMLVVRGVSVEGVMENGVQLGSGDLQTLGVIIEEEESLDTLLGLHTEGVSRGHLASIFDMERTGVRYRLDKLEEAGLIERSRAEALPEMPKSGSAPVYAVPTDLGRRVVDEHELLPLLARDWDVEEVVDQVVGVVEEMHEKLLLTSGVQGEVLAALTDLGRVVDVEIDEAISMGATNLDMSEEGPFGDDLDQEIITRDLDPVEQEMVIDRLLDTSTNE